MQNSLRGEIEADWRSGLRRAALNAPVGDRRAMLSGVVGLAALAFVAMLVVLPSQLGITSAAAAAIGEAVGQAQRLADGRLTSSGIYPLAYPFWLLLLSRFTSDLVVAARILSGLAAVLCLFFAYQLCHSAVRSERADEQATLMLLALALSPSFFVLAAGGGTEMPHLVLLLWSMLCIQRALNGTTPFTSMVLAGLLAGLSLLLRPLSILILPAAVVWLWANRPFGRDDSDDNLRPSLGFVGGFVVGAAPQLLLNLSQDSPSIARSLAELGMLWTRLTSQPLAVLLGAIGSIVQYLVADDLERLGAVTNSWYVGAWGDLPGAIIALSPTILKALGLCGLLALCWLDRFESAVSQSWFPATFLGFLAVGGGLGLVDERSLLPVVVLLIVFAYAGIPSLMPGALGSGIGIALVGLLFFNQLGIGFSLRLAPSYRASDQVAAELRAAGAHAGQVMSTTWTYYDTRSPLKDRYAHLPIYVNALDGVVTEMERRGASYLVFDRQAGAEHWPELASLIETERARPRLHAVHAPIRTDESPPNAVAIYRLD